MSLNYYARTRAVTRIYRVSVVDPRSMSLIPVGIDEGRDGGIPEWERNRFLPIKQIPHFFSISPDRCSRCVRTKKNRSCADETDRPLINLIYIGLDRDATSATVPAHTYFYFPNRALIRGKIIAQNVELRPSFSANQRAKRFKWKLK